MRTAHCRSCGTTQPVDDTGCCPAGHDVAPPPTPDEPEATEPGAAGPEPEPWVLELDEMLAAGTRAETAEGPETAQAGDRTEVRPPTGEPDEGAGPGTGAEGGHDAAEDPALGLLEAAMAELDESEDPGPGTSPGDEPTGQDVGTAGTSPGMSREEMISALPEAPRPPAAGSEGPAVGRPAGERGPDTDGGDTGDRSPAADQTVTRQPPDEPDPASDDGPGTADPGGNGRSDEGLSIDPANFTAGGDRVRPGDRPRPTRRLLPFGR